MTFLLYFTISIFILVSLLLILMILIQKGRGGGLSSAFGGGGGGGTAAFGTKTGDVLTWATAIMFGIFVLLAIALNFIVNHRSTATAVPVLPDTSTSVVVPENAGEAPAAETPAAPAPAGEGHEGHDH